MLTNNYYNVFKSALGSNTHKACNYAGTEYTLKYSDSACLFDYTTSVSKSYSTNCVVFGNGSTIPTKEDYILSGTVIGNLGTSALRRYEEDTDGAKIVTTYTITNNNNEDITIGEIGYMGSLRTSSSGATACLMDRTLLDEPVTIPAGGVGQVTYTINFNIA